MIRNIADQTNKYSVQRTGSSVGTTPSEIEQLIGMHLLMGVIRMPSYRMYWSEQTRYPPIADVMPLKRFEQLRRYLHVNDNTDCKPTTHADHDRLFKLRPLLTAFQANCLSIDQESEQSIDEQIVPYKGRVPIKQYVRNKPHKWGFKLFLRCGVSGIVYDFRVYTGKGTVSNAADSGLGISGNVVLDLCQNVPRGRNFEVYFDNWFSSEKLVEELKKDGILSVGTIRQNRLKGCPLSTDKQMKKDGRGAVSVAVKPSSGICAVKWMDSRPVTMISSHLGVEPAGQVKRWSTKEKKEIKVQCPAIVEVYNKHMGGVDLCDMMMELYRIKIRHKRWYIKLVFHFVQLATVNGWFLLRRHCGQRGEKCTLSLMEFTVQIADALCRAGKPLVTPKRGRPAADAPAPSPSRRARKALMPLQDIRRDRLDHFAIHASRGKCAHCKTGFTRWKCEKCKVMLCLNKNNNCFYSFHKV